MPKPSAPYELHKLYNGEVEVKFFTTGHIYKIHDKKYKRNWEQSPSPSGIAGKMDKGAGLMMYAMSESMKYITRTLRNTSLEDAIEGNEFSLTEMFKKARQAHIDKTQLGQSVGTKSHDYVERLLKALIQAQTTKTQFIVPPVPSINDLQADLLASFTNIATIVKFDSVANAERFAATIAKDINVRTHLWQEAFLVHTACESAREFFVAAVKQGVLRPLSVEKIVHSRKYFFTGRFDSILEFTKPFSWRGYGIPKGIYIVDFKTSNKSVDYPMGIYPNFLPQVGLYDVALCEEFPEWRDKITGHLILGSSKHGDGFFPYVAKDREANRQWGIDLVPVVEHMHLGEKELRGVDLYGGKK
jgi:hypothetical protein